MTYRRLTRDGCVRKGISPLMFAELVKENI